MQLAEVGKLLAIVKSFDNRKLDESTAMAWKMMLDRHVPDATLEQATEVVMDWFGAENPYFEVRHLVDGLRKRLRLTPKAISADVRSAKARGLIPLTYSHKLPLPADVAARLEELRAEAREAAPEIEYGDSVLALDVGRRV